MVVDTVGDIVSGIASVAVVTAASTVGIVAAPFTAGASLGMIAGGVALGGAVGAATKVAIKGSDCIGNEKTYGLKDLGYDLVTGSINGAMGPVTNALGGAAGTGIMKAAGMEALETTVKSTAATSGKEIVEEGIEQAAKQTFKQTAIKVAASTADMVVDGSLSGATDAASRALAEGRIEDIPSDAFGGLVSGAVASPIIGGGFKIAGKGGSKIGRFLKNSDLTDNLKNIKISTDVVDSLKSTKLYKAAGEVKDVTADIDEIFDIVDENSQISGRMTIDDWKKQNEILTITSPDKTQIDGQLAFAEAAPSEKAADIDEIFDIVDENSQIAGQMTIDDWKKQINKYLDDENSQPVSKQTPAKENSKISTKTYTDNQSEKIQFSKLTQEEKLKTIEKIYGNSEFEKFRDKIHQLDEKQLSKIFELTEVDVYNLDDAIKYAQLDDISYSRFVEFKKNGGRSITDSTIDDPDITLKKLGELDEKQAARLSELTKINIMTLDTAIDVATLDDTSYSRLVEFKKSGGEFSVHDIQKFSGLSDDQYQIILDLQQKGISSLDDAIDIAKADDGAYSRYINLCNMDLQISDTIKKRLVQFSDSQYQKALDLIKKGVLPESISSEILDDPLQYQKALELSQFEIPGYNISKGAALEGINYKKELDKLRIIKSGLEKSSIGAQAESSFPVISDEMKQKIVEQLKAQDVQCSFNDSIEQLAYLWKTKYITGVNALDNDLTNLIMPYAMEKYTSEYAQPMARWMYFDSNIRANDSSMLYDDFVQTFPDVGEIYEPKRLQSFAKTLDGAEKLSGNHFDDSNKNLNVKFVVYPKNKLTQALDTGNGKYGADEVIYMPNQKFKVLYKTTEYRKEIGGKPIYSIYMQEY